MICKIQNLQRTEILYAQMREKLQLIIQPAAIPTYNKETLIVKKLHFSETGKYNCREENKAVRSGGQTIGESYAKAFHFSKEQLTKNESLMELLETVAHGLQKTVAIPGTGYYYSPDGVQWIFLVPFNC